jgi:anti-sigma-K factor RskA
MRRQEGFVMLGLILAGIIILVVVGLYLSKSSWLSGSLGSGVMTARNDYEQEVREAKEMVENELEKVLPSSEYTGKLKDVTGGKASGNVSVVFRNSYKLKASFDDLPQLDEDYFYEGWVIRKSPLSVISTGRAEIIEDKWVNEFASVDDLTDHAEYVLTLEPDDGDPEPAEHLLEGEMGRI